MDLLLTGVFIFFVFLIEVLSFPFPCFTCFGPSAVLPSQDSRLQEESDTVEPEILFSRALCQRAGYDRKEIYRNLADVMAERYQRIQHAPAHSPKKGAFYPQPLNYRALARRGKECDRDARHILTTLSGGSSRRTVHKTPDHSIFINLSAISISTGS